MARTWLIALVMLTSCDEHREQTFTTVDGRRYQLLYDQSRTWHPLYIFQNKRLLEYRATETLTRLDGKDAVPMEIRGDNGLTVCPKGTDLSWGADPEGKKKCSFIHCDEARECPDRSGTVFCGKDHRCR